MTVLSFRHRAWAAAILLFALSSGAALADATYTRIVSLGGAVTEIVVALGQQDRLVARDATSIWPESIRGLPDVGYIRALSPESVLSMNPDLILAEEGAGPPQAIEVLKSAGIPVVMIPNRPDLEGVADKILAVGKAIGVEARSEELAASVTARFQESGGMAASVPEQKTVLFVLSLKSGRVMAGDENSSAESIIALAGATNAVSGFEGFKPISDEAILAAAPDVILMMDRQGELSIGNA